MNDQMKNDTTRNIDARPIGEAEFDAVVNALRDETPSPEAERAAAGRVWATLRKAAEGAASGAIQGCEDYEALVPTYLAGELSEAQTLLFEDHTRHCVSCRRALHAARAGAAASAPAAVEPTPFRLPVAIHRGWAMAAMLALAFGLAGFFSWNSGLLPARAAMAQVDEASGAIFQIAEDGSSQMAAGQGIARGEVIRSAHDEGGVITLHDGSRVELAPRSELSLAQRRGDTIIQVARGNIIVNASDQGSGHLYVDTDACEVAVQGTVFAVNHGTRGSRVSVIEGKVSVRQGTDETLLRPGQQVSTNPSLGAVPLSDEIGWSRFSDEHMALLEAELEALGQAISDLPRPEPRYSSTLLERLPSDTAIFVSIPNLSETLAQANDLLQARIDESEVLRSWWDAKFSDTEAEIGMNEAIDTLSELGGYIGEEIVFATTLDDEGEPVAPMVLADLIDAAGFRAALETKAAEISAEVGEELPLRFVDDASDLDALELELEALRQEREAALAEALARAELDAGTVSDYDTEAADEATDPDAALDVEERFESNDIEAMLVWVGSDRFVMAMGVDAMRTALAANEGFVGSPFENSISSAYAEGVDWLFAIDLASAVQMARREAQAEGDEIPEAAFDGSGFSNARHLVVTQRENGGHTDTRAQISFDGERRGVSSWLAEPGPMGALDFIAPDAHVAAAFVTRDPAEVFDEMLETLSQLDGDARVEFDEMQAEENLDIRNDLAAPMGGEFAFAMDGPLLPEPAWKVVLEVYDAERLQTTIETMIERINAEAAEERERAIVDGSSDADADDGTDASEPDAASPMDRDLPDFGLSLSSETKRGRTYYTIDEARTGLSIHYIYAEGYLIASSIEGMLDRALQYRSSGVNLRTAPDFDKLLAPDDEMNVSALMYQNLGPVAGPLADFVADKAAEQDEMNDGEASALREAVVAGAEVPATLAYVYALPDRIILSGRSDGGPLGLGLGALLGMDGFLGIHGDMDMHHDFDHEGMRPQGQMEEDVTAPISSDL